MAKKGYRFTFHGAYVTKARAVAKERELKARGLAPFVRGIVVRGARRYAVLTRRAHADSK